MLVAWSLIFQTVTSILMQISTNIAAHIDIPTLNPHKQTWYKLFEWQERKPLQNLCRNKTHRVTLFFLPRVSDSHRLPRSSIPGFSPRNQFHEDPSLAVEGRISTERESYFSIMASVSRYLSRLRRRLCESSCCYPAVLPSEVCLILEEKWQRSCLD